MYMYMYTHPYDAEYLWHVVPCVLFDDGYDLSQLFEEILPHPTVTRPNHTQERRHHLHVGVKGQRRPSVRYMYMYVCTSITISH